MALSTAPARYQNALLYGPGMGVGHYPERSAATMPGLSITQPAPTIYAPPAPVSYAPITGGNALLSQAPAAMQAPAAPSLGSSALGSALMSLGLKGVRELAGIGDMPSLFDLDASSVTTDVAPLSDLPMATVDEGVAGMAPVLDGAFSTGTSAAPIDAFANFGGDVDTAIGQGIGATATAADTGAGLLDGFQVDPYNMAASALGTWGGGQLAKAIYKGDQQDQSRNSALTGAAGGAAVGSIIPGIGTLIGAFVGALIGGTGLAGEPDNPYGFAAGNVLSGANGPAFDFSGTGSMNGGRDSWGSNIGNWLSGSLSARAAQEGMQVNPAQANQNFGFAGYRPDRGYYFSEAGHAPGEADPAWTGADPNGLADAAYGALVGGNWLVPQGWTPPAADAGQAYVDQGGN